MALEDVLTHEELGVEGNNFTEGEIATEGYTFGVIVNPAHRQTLTDYIRYKEVSGILNGMTEVDKAFAIESISMLPALMTQNLEHKLTSHPSAINKTMVGKISRSYEAASEEALREIATDVFLTCSDLLSKVSERLDEIDFYKAEAESLLKTIKETEVGPLVVVEGKSLNLFNEPVHVIAYKISDTGLMYKPFEGKLNDTAKAVIETFQSGKLDTLQRLTFNLEIGTVRDYLSAIVSNLDKVAFSLSRIRTGLNTMSNSPTEINELISELDLVDTCFKFFHFGQAHLDSVFELAKFLIAKGK